MLVTTEHGSGTPSAGRASSVFQQFAGKGGQRRFLHEPTILHTRRKGQLDGGTAATVMHLISELVHPQGVTAVVAAHDPLLIERADRVLTLHDERMQP